MWQWLWHLREYVEMLSTSLRTRKDLRSHEVCTAWVRDTRSVYRMGMEKVTACRGRRIYGSP
jgi:hypothetical protein